MWNLYFPYDTNNFHRYFKCIYVDGYHYSYDKGVWVEKPNKYEWYDEYTDVVRCKTFKAFKRHLMKHPELKGRKVTLMCMFYDKRDGLKLDIIAEWE